MDWLTFKATLKTYRQTTQVQGKATCSLDAAFSSCLTRVLLAYIHTPEVWERYSASVSSRSNFRWRSDSLLLYVVTSSLERPLNHPSINDRVGEHSTRCDVLINRDWLADACCRFPTHRLVIVSLDDDSENFMYTGMLVQPIAYLAPLIKCPETPLAFRPQGTRRRSDINSDNASHFVLPADYIDFSYARLLEELSLHNVPTIKYRAPAYWLRLPTLDLSRLRFSLLQHLTADDSSAHVVDWFNARISAMVDSHGSLHVNLPGEENVSFAMLLFGIIARCVSEPSAELHRRALAAFMNFEMNRASVQLFQRCTSDTATVYFLRSNEPVLRALSDRGHSLEIIEAADIDNEIRLALENCNVFYVRTDMQRIDHAFRYRGALRLFHTFSTKRGVLFRGDLYLTYHDVPFLLSDAYAVVIEQLVLEAGAIQRGELPEFLLPFPDKWEFLELVFERARERFLKVQGKRVKRAGGGAAAASSSSVVVLPDIEDIGTKAAPLCMVNSMDFLKHEARLPHYSRFLLYRHLLDTGYSTHELEQFANKHVNAETVKDHIDSIRREEKTFNDDKQWRQSCQFMFAKKFDRDKDSRGCPYAEQDEQNLAALLLASGMSASDPALPRIINKALVERHPKAACAMHASARIRATVGPQPYDRNRGASDAAFPFDSPAEHVHYVLGSIQNHKPTIAPPAPSSPSSPLSSDTQNEGEGGNMMTS